MANSDYTIADQTGASFLTDINGQLAAIQTNNSKGTAPVAADGVAVGMLWYNSATTTQSGIPAGTVGVCTSISPDIVWTQIQTGLIVTDDITNSSVITGKINDDAVTSNKLANSLVLQDVRETVSAVTWKCDCGQRRPIHTLQNFRNKSNDYNTSSSNN